MASQQKPHASHGGCSLISTNQGASRTAAKHRKPRPSVNVELAQNYRERQDLPPVERGDPGIEGISENIPSPETEYIQIILDESVKIDPQRKYLRQGEQESKAEEDRPPRDYVTGRMLSEYGRSCLRCTEKGLRCTFNYIGKETESQCAACRRSKVPYCVRFQPPRRDKKPVPYNGPPWKNPNFVAGTAEDSKTARLQRRELEDILREFYHGESGYVLGNYVAESDSCNYVLPPFNGVDLPLIYRPNGYENMGWKDVLPDWRNRSLGSQQREREEEDERERRKKGLAMARQRSLQPLSLNEEKAEEVHRRNVLTTQVAGESESGDDEINFLRTLRRYRPRERNLVDVLGEIL